MEQISKRLMNWATILEPATREQAERTASMPFIYPHVAARRTFTRAQLDEAMAGIEWGRSDAFLDEIPGAYKDIGTVMADAADLVQVQHKLRQVINVKGD